MESSEGSASKREDASDSIFQHPVPEFLQKGRNNPINGTTCFFSEATFRKIVGPEPSFREKFLIQLTRAKEARAAKPEEKKKRHKDLDLPGKPVSDPKRKISSNTENVTLSKPPENLNKTVQDNDSSDDDEFSTDLIIADDEENLGNKFASENGSPVKPSADVSPEEGKDRNEAPESVDVADRQQSKTLSMNSVQDEGTIPLYAAGISSQMNSGLLSGGGKDENTLKKVPMSEIVYDVLEAGDDTNLQRQPEKEESICLVMPPPVTESDDDGDAGDDNSEKTETSAPSGSSLPLIPALMSEPARAHRASKAVKTANLLKPKVMSAFYVSDEARTSSIPESQIPSLISLTASASTEDEIRKVDADVPIFSLAGSSEGVNPAAGIKRSLRNKGIWSSAQGGNQAAATQKPKNKDNSMKDALKFRQSSLTKNQMAQYLELFEKYARPFLHGGSHPMFTERQKRELADFESLQGRVQNEQREFQAYLQQNAIRNPDYYIFIKGNAKHYAYAKAQSFRPPKNLVIKFSHKFGSTVPLRATSERVDLTFQRHLLEMGSPPKITLPEAKPDNSLVKIPHDMAKIEQNFPSVGRKKRRNILHHESVAEDGNAEALAIKYGTNTVLSSSVVKCLLDNRDPEFKRTWNIPVTIKEHQTEHGPQKVVYMNKPIYEDNLLLRDCNALFHKYALRTMVSTPKNSFELRSLRQQSQPCNIGAQKRIGAKTAEDPFDLFATDLEALETFGKATGFDKKNEMNESAKAKDLSENDTTCRKSPRAFETGSEKTSLSQAEPVEERNSSSKKSLEKQTEMDDSLKVMVATTDQQPGRFEKGSLDDLSLDQSGISEGKETPSTWVKKAREGDSVCSKPEAGHTESSTQSTEDSSSKSSRPKRRVASQSLFSSPAKKAKQPEQKPQPQLSFSPDAQASNCNLLDLILGPDVSTSGKKETTPHVQENPSHYTPHSEPLSSLVYSQWELGQNKILIRTRSHGISKTRAVYITAKLEYQPNHGFEQVTSEELVRDWTACYIRPNSLLLRGRINPYTSEIIMFEEFECHEILKRSSFRPQEGFAFMNTLFTHLSSLDPGNYLVSHEPGMDFCGIRTLKVGARLDNIEKPVPTPPETQLSRTSVPWIPLDTNLLLPYHKLHQRIPATFLPRDVIIEPGTKKPQKQKNVPASLIKKKKKKKNKGQKKNKEREFFD